MGLKDADARGRIAALEEKANDHCHIIVMLQNEVTQLSTDFGRLVGEILGLRSAAAGIQTLSEEVSGQKTQIAQILNDLVFEELWTELSELRKEVLALRVQIAMISPTVTPFQNQPPPPSAAISASPIRSELAAYSISNGSSALSAHDIHSIPETGACSISSNTPVLRVRPICPRSEAFSISRAFLVISTVAACSVARFADHFRFSRDLRRVPTKVNLASVARQPRWFQNRRISRRM
jgi:archaellum component FlaC